MKKKILVFFGLLLIFACAGLFLLRAPVILVHDLYFAELYGKKRLFHDQIRSSFRLWRRFRVLKLADSLDPSGVSFAVSSFHPEPYGVIFPYHFLEGAEQYARDHSGSTVIVFLGREDAKTGRENGIYYASPDRSGDLYRAGMAAALFAGGEEGRVLCYAGASTSPEARDAFTKGLTDKGHREAPLFIDPSVDYGFSEKIHVVLVAEPTERYFSKNLPYPVVLFSWMNWDYTGDNVKVIFNDAPSFLGVEALRAAKEGLFVDGKMNFPSGMEIREKRIDDAEKKKSLKAIMAF